VLRELRLNSGMPPDGVGDCVPLFDSAAAVHELLRGSPRRAVQFLRAFLDPKSSTKLPLERFNVISNDVQAAALGWSFRSEGAHDHMAA
jgi:hypothetical protein